MRGPDAVPQSVLDEGVASQNLILIFGCPPGREVNADSCLISRFLQRVDASRLQNGAVVLPGKINNFRTPNGGETICTHDFFLHFYGPDPLAYVDAAENDEPNEEIKEPTDTEETKAVELTLQKKFDQNFDSLAENLTND